MPPFPPAILTTFPFSMPECAAFGAVATGQATPAFASAADALRAKIRACAARSFAAQHEITGESADPKRKNGETTAAMAARGSACRIG